jgi:hypothetical protein
LWAHYPQCCSHQEMKVLIFQLFQKIGCSLILEKIFLTSNLIHFQKIHWLLCSFNSSPDLILLEIICLYLIQFDMIIFFLYFSWVLHLFFQFIHIVIGFYSYIFNLMNNFLEFISLFYNTLSMFLCLNKLF